MSPDLKQQIKNNDHIFEHVCAAYKLYNLAKKDMAKFYLQMGKPIDPFSATAQLKQQEDWKNE